MPEDDIFFRVEENVVGVFTSPCADSIFTATVHVSGVTYFWDISARKMSDDIPCQWGVTANLIARRNVRYNVKFNLYLPPKLEVVRT